MYYEQSNLVIQRPIPLPCLSLRSLDGDDHISEQNRPDRFRAGRLSLQLWKSEDIRRPVNSSKTLIQLMYVLIPSEQYAYFHRL